MGRRGGMAACVMAIVLLVALFASSSKCRPEPLDEAKASGSIGNAMAALNSTAALVINGGSSGSGDAKLQWCIQRNCVKEGRGNGPCFCCAAPTPPGNEDLPPPCYDAIDQCHQHCV